MKAFLVAAIMITAATTAPLARCTEARTAELPADAPPLERARAAIAQSQWAEARAVLEPVAANNTAPLVARVTALNLLATVFARENQLEQARDALARAVALDPDFDLGWENLGDVHLAQALHAYAQATRSRNSPRLHEKAIKVRGIFEKPAADKPVERASPVASPASATASPARSAANAAGPDTPTTVSATAPASDAPPEVAVLAALEAWRAAWQNRQVDTYLDTYAGNFRPLRGTLETWRAERSRRLFAAQKVDIRLEHVRVVTQQNSNQVRVQFVEHLEADGFRRIQRKQIDWQREAGAWRIVAERPI